MRKQTLFCLLMTAIAMAGVLPVLMSAKNLDEEAYLKENVEALSEVVNSSDSICYSEYEFSLIRRVLVCGKCEIKWGKGITEGGRCTISDEEEEE